MRKIFLIFFLFFILSNKAFSDEIVRYKANFFSIPAGYVEITLKNNGDVYAEGKTGGLISLIYQYYFRFKKVGDQFYLQEDEKGKIKNYSTDEILQKKPWIPILIQIVTTKNFIVGSYIDIGKGISLKLTENIENKILFFRVKGSSNVKEIIVWYDKEAFPKFIRILTKETSMDFDREYIKSIE